MAKTVENVNVLKTSVAEVFRDGKAWRSDGHITAGRLKFLFQDYFEQLAIHSNNRAEVKRLAPRCSVLVKLHWDLCSQSRQSSLDRQGDVEKLLEYISEIEENFGKPSISFNFSELSESENEVLPELVADLKKFNRTNFRKVSFGPLLNSLGQVARQGGHFRLASVLGLGGSKKLSETAESDIMDRFLSANRMLMKNAS